MKILNSQTLKSFLAVVCALILASCASTPNTISNVDPNADFSQYKTFGFFDPLATDEAGYESIVSSFLKVAMAEEMARRGFSYAEDADLKVNFYVNSKEKIRSRSVPTMGAYYGYRDPFFYDPWMGHMSYETQIDQYTEGTLNIDVVDAGAKRLVWEGVVSGRVTNQAIEQLEDTIKKAVGDIMANFPVAPKP